MRRIKDRLAEIIGQEACRRTGELAGELVRAESDDKEAILAEMELQRWLAETAEESLGRP